MSRSFRTQKEAIIARRHIVRVGNGAPLVPRIIERAPAPGDIHPVPKRNMRFFLERVPVDYLYGLRRIELRARAHGRSLGNPFGHYLGDERAIYLYSLPPVWICEGLDEGFRRSLQKFRASIEMRSEGFVISWPKRARLALWFFSYVIAHELGHHFAEQYKFKNRRNPTSAIEEAFADLHSRRVTDAFFEKMWAER